jgi:hypothetical protein
MKETWWHVIAMYSVVLLLLLVSAEPVYAARRQYGTEDIAALKQLVTQLKSRPSLSPDEKATLWNAFEAAYEHKGTKAGERRSRAEQMNAEGALSKLGYTRQQLATEVRASELKGAVEEAEKKRKFGGEEGPKEEKEKKSEAEEKGRSEAEPLAETYSKVDAENSLKNVLDRAEILYKRAVEIDPLSVNNVGANVLLVKSQIDEYIAGYDALPATDLKKAAAAATIATLKAFSENIPKALHSLLQARKHLREPGKVIGMLSVIPSLLAPIDVLYNKIRKYVTVLKVLHTDLKKRDPANLRLLLSSGDAAILSASDKKWISDKTAELESTGAWLSTLKRVLLEFNPAGKDLLPELTGDASKDYLKLDTGSKMKYIFPADTTISVFAQALSKVTEETDLVVIRDYFDALALKLGGRSKPENAIRLSNLVKKAFDEASKLRSKSSASTGSAGGASEEKEKEEKSKEASGASGSAVDRALQEFMKNKTGDPKKANALLAGLSGAIVTEQSYQGLTWPVQVLQLSKAITKMTDLAKDSNVGKNFEALRAAVDEYEKE